MIIVDCKWWFSQYKKTLYFERNNYVDSIDYLNNEFNEILIKRKVYDNIIYLNLKEQYHNPIGPAAILYDYDKQLYLEDYWINNVQYTKEEFPEAIKEYKNDYYNL